MNKKQIRKEFRKKFPFYLIQINKMYSDLNWEQAENGKIEDFWISILDRLGKK